MARLLQKISAKKAGRIAAAIRPAFGASRAEN
jgi:hypothetical protein